MIDVIIPAYNAHKTLGNALASIAKQQNKDDVKVYIIDDGSEKDYKDIVKEYSSSLDIELIRTENSGPGMARQTGIDSSKNEFIVFLDSDDELYDEYSLTNLINNITDADLSQGRYIEKSENSEKEMDPQYCYLHGKMYRRSIIKKNKIRFEKSPIRKGDIYEDSTFNQLYRLYCKNIVNVDNFTYIYNFNDSSLTRKDKSLSLNLSNYIKAMTWLANEIERRKLDNYHEIAWDFCVAMYYGYFNYLLAPDDCQFVFTDMITIKEMYCKYIEHLPFEDKLYVYRLFNYDVIPTLTIDHFVNKIKDNNKDGMVIAMSCTQNWYHYLVVNLYSLLECTKNIRKIYLLLETDNVEDVPYLDRLIDKYNVEFVLINLNNHLNVYLDPNGPNLNTIFSNFCFSRLMLPDFVTEDKVLYIDTDAIVRKDISNIWNYDITDYYLAGVKDYGIYDDNTLERMGIDGCYVNSGFVVFNLKMIREEDIERKWFDIINVQEMTYPDQDALNKVCQYKELYIPSMYNSCEYETERLTKDVLNRDLIKVFHYPGAKDYWLADRFCCEEWYDAEEKFKRDFYY